MILLQFNEPITEGPGAGSTSDYLIEIIVMLLVAFILGYLLRLLLNGRYKKKIQDLNDENTHLKVDLAKAQEVDNTEDLKKMQTQIEHLERTKRILQTDLDLCRNETSKLKAMASVSPTEKKATEPILKESPKLTVEKKESYSEAPKPTPIPPASKQKVPGDKDDLTKVEGIGPKIQEHLNNGGIFSFEELAKSPVSRLQEILDAAGPLYKVHNPETWPEQAKLAAQGEWIALSKWQDELKGGKRK
jgi:predicted flap endonuclease-1-like 5' DNA nuclease